MPAITRLAQLPDVPELNKLIALSVRGLSTNYYTPTQIESALKYVFGVDLQIFNYISTKLYPSDNGVMFR